MADTLAPTFDDSTANSVIANVVDVPHFVESVPFAAPKYADGGTEFHE